MNLIKLFIALLMMTNNVSAEEAWNLNDVSYLYKIPNNVKEDLSQLLSPNHAGSKGLLLPKALYDKIPVLNNAGSGKETAYEKEIRVVSIRIDPCPNESNEKKCEPQIRLIWQPLSIDSDLKNWIAQDAALHSFYQLSSAEFSKLKKELWSLKIENKKSNVDTTRLALGVHPAFINTITSRKFGDDLKGIILKYCGEKNIGKITFMSLLTQNVWWRFGGIEKSNSSWKTLKIPRLKTTFQDIFNSALEENPPVFNPGTEMDAVLNILPDEYPEEENLHTLINRGMRYNDERDHNIFVEKLNAVERFRNPHKTNPTNLDCASCHFADDAKFFAAKKFPDLENFNSIETYKNPNPLLFDLSNNTIGKSGTRLVRAFGYFYTKPSINQRTINDSAESALWMNKYK